MRIFKNQSLENFLKNLPFKSFLLSIKIIAARVVHSDKEGFILFGIFFLKKSKQNLVIISALIFIYIYYNVNN